MFESLGNIVLAALGISFLIFIHELGHFIAARIFSVRVETFSIGFGPRIFGMRRGDTDYRLSAIPLGGYVKMAGEYGDYDDDTVLAPDDLNAKPAWQRAIIFSGGVLVNFAFAFVAFPIVFALGVPFTAPIIGSVAPGGAAWNAGLQPGDEILAIGGRRLYEFNDIMLEVALGDPEGFTARIRRDDDTFEVLLAPDRNEDVERWEIGVEPAFSPVLHVDPNGLAAQAGLEEGDVILAAGGRDLVGDPGWWHRLYELIDPGQPFVVTVQRGAETITAAIEPGLIFNDPDQYRLGVLSAATRVVGIRGKASELRGSDDQRLLPGDVVLAVGAVAVTAGSGIRDQLTATPSATLVVRRDDEIVDIIPLPAVVQAIRAENVAFGHEDTGCRIRVVKGGAAAEAGLLDGDEIRTMDGQSVMSYQELVDVLRDSDTHRHSLRLRRDGADVTLLVEAQPTTAYVLGIAPGREQIVYETGLVGSLIAGFETSINGLRTTWLTLTKLISGDVGTQNMGGIVAISKATYEVAGMSFAKLLFFLALLSINLGIINILPIPVLDGGQIMFLIFEKIKGSRLSERFLNGAQLAGLVAILVLVVYVTYNDIQNLISGP
jgi:regulator of sigma E protease